MKESGGNLGKHYTLGVKQKPKNRKENDSLGNRTVRPRDGDEVSSDDLEPHSGLYFLV